MFPAETVIGVNAALMEKLYLLRELCATKDEKLAQVEQECVTLRDQIDHLQSVIRDSENSKANLKNTVDEQAQVQQHLRYRLLFNFNNITCRH